MKPGAGGRVAGGWLRLDDAAPSGSRGRVEEGPCRRCRPPGEGRKRQRARAELQQRHVVDDRRRRRGGSTQHVPGLGLETIPCRNRSNQILYLSVEAASVRVRA